MSAMGERFLLLEETADALDVIDPELARQFRLVNGLPFAALGVGGPQRFDPPFGVATGHAASIEEGPDGIRVACSCGDWHAEVGWDEIDDLVVAARAHFGTEGGPILGGDDVHGDESGAAGSPPIRRWVS
jgi:hypothetical protein